MPLLDPGRVVASPFLSDSIWITQQAESLVRGRSVVTPSSRRSRAIVNSAGRNELERLPEAQRSKRAMTFVTRDRVRPVSPNAQPDILTWPAEPPEARKDFLVYAVDPYPQYGVGWYVAIAVSTDIVDAPL